MHIDSTASPFAQLRTLGLSEARVQGHFWAERQRVNQASLMHAFDRMEAAGNFHNLKLAQGEAEGRYREPLFMDSDIYKWLEAVGYALARGSRAALEAMARCAIQMLARTQCADGYLNSYYQTVKPDRRWQELAHGHELYCAGHLFEAAVAFKRGTGDDSLLRIAVKFADLIAREFGPEARQGPPGHPEIELALVELARETGERRFVALADFFLERRGRGSLIGPKQFPDGYYQDRVPVREAEELEGHAVRQLYLTAGMTDVWLETGDERLRRALDRLWRDLAARKLHITGGVGARRTGEAFGAAYELPNDTTYCETCAAIANAMWNWRLLLATGESRYADLLERSLYNCALAGVSLDGKRYFYENPLSSDGSLTRPAWYGCACCPPNLMRLIELIAHYAVTFSADAIQIHQYLDGTFQGQGEFGAFGLRTRTAYPHQGDVEIVITEAPRQPVGLDIRIPAWTQDRVRISLDDKDVGCRPTETGYARIHRAWRAGDTVRVAFELSPRLTAAHPRVDAARGAIAIERGPLVYCLEAVDNAAVEHLAYLRIDPQAALTEAFDPDCLGGVHRIAAQGWTTDAAGWQESLYRPFTRPDHGQRTSMVAIPYYAWANRDPGAMQVWTAQG